MHDANRLHEIQNILADAQPTRRGRLFVVLSGLGLLFVAAAGYVIVDLANENDALSTEIAGLNQAPSRAELLANQQRLKLHGAALQDQLARLQQELTRRTEDSTRPITREELFVLEEMTRNAAWRKGRTHDATLAHLLDEFGISELAELTRGQWPNAIAHLYEIGQKTTRRAYDPATSGQ